MSNPHNEQTAAPATELTDADPRVTGPLLRQGETTEPIIEQSSLPLMSELTPEPRPIGGRIRMMGDDDGADRSQGRGPMPPLPSDAGRPPQLQDQDREPPPPVPAKKGRVEGGGYLRLLLRVDDEEMSLFGVSKVEGPLAPPEPMYGGLAYEVRIGAQPIGVGQIPDPKTRRGYAPPDDPTRGHSQVEVSSYEFTARVPADRLSLLHLPDLQIAIYRLDSRRVLQPSLEQPLAEQAECDVEEVAALRGILTERLPAELRSGLEQALA